MKQRFTARLTASLMAAVLIAMPLQNIAYADEPTGETKTQEMYIVGNTGYENASKIMKGNGHDCQNLGIWVPSGATFSIRQVNTELNQALTFKMRNDDVQTESVNTIPADGSWLTVTAKADSVPFVQSIYRADGKKPIVEFTLENTYELPVYKQGDDEKAFFEHWRKLDAPFAVYESKEYAIFLVPKRDMNSNKIGSLEDLCIYYDNMIRQYNAFSGLTKDAPEVYNRDSGTRYFIKANKHGAGGAYYSPAETAVNGNSVAGYMEYNWGSLHEVAHGYDTVNFASGEIWNNVYAHYYQLASIGRGTWLSLTEDSRKLFDSERVTNNYFGTQNFQAKLYFWVNMMDKIGPQKSASYSYKKYRKNSYEGVANLGGHSFYADAFTEGTGYNVTPWFDMWGFTVTQDVKENLIEAEVYKNIYPLQNLVATEEKAEKIKTALGLASRYSMVETQQLVDYSKNTEETTGTLKFTLDDTAYTAINGKDIRITDGINTVENITVTGKEVTANVPVGVYNVFVPAPGGEKAVVINNRIGYTTVKEGDTAVYNITAEEIGGTEFYDATIALGSNYSYWGNYFVAVTDIKNMTLRMVTNNANPHTVFGANTFSSFTVLDENGEQVVSKIHPGTGVKAGDETIPIKVGYRFKIYHANYWRGCSVKSSAVSEYVYGEKEQNSEYVVTEYGLEKVSPTAISAQDSFYGIVVAYLNKVKAANEKTDFRNADKLAEEKAKVNSAYAKFTTVQQENFKTEFAGYFPFNEGVKNFDIAEIPPQDYTGEPVKAPLKVSANGKELTEGTDYRTEYINNVEIGTARIRIYGLNDYDNYVGDVIFEIRRSPQMSTEFTVVSDVASYEYSGGAKRPSATVTIDGKTLTRGVDYNLSWADNTNVGTAKIIATGIGNYVGISGEGTFRITGKVVKLEVEALTKMFSYNGKAHEPELIVTYDRTTLKAGTDYTAEYTNNVEIGTANIKVTGIGNFGGSTGEGTFLITEPETPIATGGNAFSNWKLEMKGWVPSIYCQIVFDVEKGKLQVISTNAKPHDLVDAKFAEVAVYDTKGSRVYYKYYHGNRSNGAGTDVIDIGLGYTVEMYFREPTRGTMYSTAASAAKMPFGNTTKFEIVPEGLRRITPDEMTEADANTKYSEVVGLYMDAVVKNSKADLADKTKITDYKQAVETALKLFNADNMNAFRTKYAASYPFNTPFAVTDENGIVYDGNLKAGSYKARLVLLSGQETAAVVIAKYVDGALAESKYLEPTQKQEVIETEAVTVTDEDLTKNVEVKAFAWDSMGNIRPIYDLKHITK